MLDNTEQLNSTTLKITVSEHQKYAWLKLTQYFPMSHYTFTTNHFNKSKQQIPNTKADFSTRAKLYKNSCFSVSNCCIDFAYRIKQKNFL